MPLAHEGLFNGGNAMKNKILDIIGGLIAVTLFNLFMLWALFLAPAALAF